MLKDKYGRKDCTECNFPAPSDISRLKQVELNLKDRKCSKVLRDEIDMVAKVLMVIPGNFVKNKMNYHCPLPCPLI